MNDSRINLPELSVSELSSALKRTIEDAYGYVRVRGELGKVSYHSNGHVYCDLKDDRACIAGVIWRTVSSKIKLKLETGLEVVVTGRLTTYPGRSQYQLVIETVEPAGIGALMALLEERKKKLAAEGLFDEARKQILPYLPRVIGIVTSPTGAVIHDILHRLADRFPRQVVVWPVRVQGDGSAEEVAAAIRGFNALKPGGGIPVPDVIIVARGGGSLEDLWSFNEEIVVRAAADSMIPLISAVGHETDITLIDFASDKRAPTPTAAAEMAVPVRSELIAGISSLNARADAAWLRCQDARRTELRAAMRALPGADALLATPRQRLDAAAERLPLALRANTQVHGARFRQASALLSPATLRRRVQVDRDRLSAMAARGAQALAVHVARRRERYNAFAARLTAGVSANATAQRARLQHDRHRLAGFSERAQLALATIFDRRRARLDRAGQLLAALSYRGVLARGFALVRDADGQPLRSAAAVGAGQALDIEFGDGRVGVVAAGSLAGPLAGPLVSPRAESSPAARPANAPARARSKKSDGGSGQGQLF